MPSPLYDGTGRLHSRTVRRVAAGLGMLTVLFVMAPAVGEPDRRESRAIGLLRGILTAEGLHFSNHGHYDTLECLGSLECIGSPGSPSRTYQGLLAVNVVGLRDYHGYKLYFHPGARASTSPRHPLSTPLADYAMVLVPHAAEKPTTHALCGDRTERIYRTPGTRLPRVQNGRCLETSNPFQ